MLIFLVVILILAALLEAFSLRGGASAIETDFLLSKRCTEPTQPVELRTVARNASRFPVSYCVLRIVFPPLTVFPEHTVLQRDDYSLTLNDSFRLWGRQCLEHRLVFQLDQRGVYNIYGREICRGDFLGLRMKSVRYDKHRNILVYPCRLDNDALTQALGSDFGERISQQRLIRDPVLTLGIREYTGHEPMHDISWAQTARRGELTVREFDSTRSMNCCVLLFVHDLNPLERELLDRCCSTARSVCEVLLSCGIDAQLFTNAALSGYPNHAVRSVSASPNREDDLLDVLARVMHYACSNAATLVETCLSALPDAAAYVLITAREDDASEDARRMLSSRTGLNTLQITVEQLGKET